MGKTKALLAIVEELEEAVPALRELAESQAKLLAVKKEIESATAQAESARVLCERTEAECAQRVKAAQEDRDKRIAQAEADIQQRSADARTRYEGWQVSAKATKAREEADSAERQRLLAELAESVSNKQMELDEIESRLASARQAVKSALAEVA